MLLPAQTLKEFIQAGYIKADSGFGEDQIQPASLDLRLGDKAYRLRASFLPGTGCRISDCLNSDVVMHEISLKGGAVLETGCVYLVPLVEHLKLPPHICGLTNPKSSTGRLDIFSRIIGDYAQRFDYLAAGYEGPLYVEIAPRTFSILVRPKDKLVQVRLRAGERRVLRTQTVSVDLQSASIIGYRARRHAGLVDFSRVRVHPALAYWQPIERTEDSLILDPDEFYILASKETVSVAADEAAEMSPVAPEIGEFRAHYAGFFDPGFGLAQGGDPGARAVLEIRGRDVPFILRDGQAVARLLFEALSTSTNQLYGVNGAHYQGQGLRLSKHFTTGTDGV